MLICITFKTPDAVEDAIVEALRDEFPYGASEDEKCEHVRHRLPSLGAAARKWFQYGEYVTVEWNTEDNTCRVVPC